MDSRDYEYQGDGGRNRFDREDERRFGEAAYAYGGWRDVRDRVDYGRDRFDQGRKARISRTGPGREGDYGQRGYWNDRGPWSGVETRGRFGGREDAADAAPWQAQRQHGVQQGHHGMTQPMMSSTEVWLIEGPHTGRGPRGYQRSDERIKDEVCERLTQHGQVDASDIEIDVQSGEVTLRGEVDNRQAKRLAEDAVESISGVRDVHNQIRVRLGQWSSQQHLGGDTLPDSRGRQQERQSSTGSPDHGTMGTVNAGTDAERGASTATADADWQHQRGQFQQHFTSTRASQEQGRTKRTWEQAEPNYRFGYEAARSERYQGRRFDEVESDLRRDYEARTRGAGRDDERQWEQLRDEVRAGFDRMTTT